MAVTQVSRPRRRTFDGHGRPVLFTYYGQGDAGLRSNGRSVLAVGFAIAGEKALTLTFLVDLVSGGIAATLTETVVFWAGGYALLEDVSPEGTEQEETGR
jgi:hypothetical protein